MAPWREVADESLVAAVRGYACEVVGCPTDDTVSVSRFEEGNRHAVYRVAYRDAAGADASVVVRVGLAADPVACAQAEWEAGVLDKVGGVAGPRLYDFRRQSRWFDTPVMCLQFVPGHQRDMGSLAPADIEKLGAVVGRLHGRFTAPADTDEPIDVAAYAETRLGSILAGLVWARAPLPAPFQSRLRGAADTVEAMFEAWRVADGFDTGATLVLLHGDIGPGNVLWGPEPVLIDWEYARRGDPADEIAYLFDQNGLVNTQREAFWRGYAGATGSAALAGGRDRVAWWEPVTLLGSALWWAERWVRRAEADAVGVVDPVAPKDRGYYLDHVVGRLDRLAGLLATLA